MKDRLNATNKVPESLTENEKLSESFKLYVKEHFKSADHETDLHDDEDSIVGGGEVEVGQRAGVTLLTPRRFEKLDSACVRRFRLKALLYEYAPRAKEGLLTAEARYAVSSEEVILYGRMRKGVGDASVVFGSSCLGNSNRKRADYIVVSEFAAGGCATDVHYGRVLFFLEYDFAFAGNEEKTLCVSANGLTSFRKTALERFTPQGRNTELSVEPGL